MVRMLSFNFKGTMGSNHVLKFEDCILSLIIDKQLFQTILWGDRDILGFGVKLLQKWLKKMVKKNEKRLFFSKIQ